MTKSLLLAASAAALVLALPAIAASATPAHKHPAHPVAAATSSNPLLQPWTGEHGGYPPFDKVKLADFKPALEAAMAQNRREIDAIANNPQAPTFQNTIVPLEKSGQMLARVTSIYGIWASNLNTAEFQTIQAEMDPKLAAFNDSITQNAKLFARINAIYNSKAKDSLRPDQQRLVWIYWDQFTQAGAKLSPQAKARVTQINQRLASLYAQFQKNLLADEPSGYITYLTADQLSGLPQSLKDAAAQAAADHGHKGEWAITNTRSSMDPFLTYSDNRALREKVWRNYYARGDNHDANDNSSTVVEIVHLRTEKAKLMGFPTYAHWKLYDKMAKNPDAAMNLKLTDWPASTESLRHEDADMQALADKNGDHITIAPWDYRYYEEKVRKDKYALDNNEVRQYLQFDKIRDAVFWEAGQLYGFKFAKLEGVPTFAPDMSVYEVLGRDGKRVGLWYLDPYAREGKNSGAWEQPYRPQTILLGQTTIVSNNTNFVKAPAGQPTLISWDDAITIFHEFGHGLHDLNSAVIYPTQAGTAVATDFVEFPSQLNENWLSTPEVLNKFAVNAQGQSIPPELLAKIRKAKTFNQGFDVTEYLSAAIYDMKAHLAGDSFTDPDGFEKALFTELKMPSEVVMRHRPTQFFHAFESDGYAAGYYSYLWAEVLDHDAFEAFLENGGPYDPAEDKKYHDDIVSVGNTIDPGQAYRNFRGHDASIDGYLKSKGFPLPTGSQKTGGQ